MRYGITDLAKILGITTSAIRYFEKEHLIQAEKSESGRRSYDEEDVFRLLSYTKYRSMEIPMKEIVKQFSGRENDRKTIQKREEKAREDALKKAEYYHSLAGAIDEHLQGIRRIDDHLGKYTFEKSPAVVFMQDDECGWISRQRDAQETVRRWVEKMPAVQLAVAAQEHLPQEKRKGSFGYIINSKSHILKDLPANLHISHLAGELCVYTIVKAPENFAYDPQSIFRDIFQYVKKRGFIIKSQPWGKILLVEVEEGQRLHTYAEVWVPIC